MPLSVIDLYRKILPKTNCGDCGFQTCLAFASMVVSERLPLKKCPHLEAEIVQQVQAELDEQYAQGKWTKKDPAADALEWARERAASMNLRDIAERIGGKVRKKDGDDLVELPYFNTSIHITSDGVSMADNTPLNRWEQVFIFNHMAQGGGSLPSGKWKSFEEIPNTVSKLVSMRNHVEAPLVERFGGRGEELLQAGLAIGGKPATDTGGNPDLALHFTPMPRVPVMLLFWDEVPEESFGAQVKLLFDTTIVEHLDIESIMFLSERIRQLLIDAASAQEAWDP